jgi:hypothetical protein
MGRIPTSDRLIEWTARRYPSRVQPDAPAYVPSRWNHNPSLGRGSNCLGYALDTASTRGWRTVAPVAPTVATLKAALTRLGLRRATVPSLLARRAGRHLVAVLATPGLAAGDDIADFHCYRLDRDGKWSHKPGSDPVQRLDADGDPITTIDKAKHPLFVVRFVGLYWATLST